MSPLLQLGMGGRPPQPPQPSFDPTPADGLQGAQAQDPRSIYLARALQQMGSQPQGNGTGLVGNLLASALDQYALKQRRDQLARPPTPVGVDAATQATVPF